MFPPFPLDVPEVCASSAQSPTDSNGPHAEVKDLIRGFLNRSDYKSPQSPCDAVLRKRLTAELASWPPDINTVLVAKIMDGSCVYAETTYGHTTHEHRYFIALYTACLMYVDDLGERDLDAVMRFTRRFAQGERQPDPILQRLAELLGRAHTIYALGLGSVPLLPYMEHWTLGVNDILSFYKEELAGEMNNYVHLRASAEQTSVTIVLGQLVEEVLESASRMNDLTAEDPELAVLWQRYMQGYLEFSLKAKRYRLAELGYQP